MGLDQLLELTSSVASKALPICGVVVLIFLAVFVKHLIVLLKNANDAVVKMAKTLETTNRQLETLDKPLNTLNELVERGVNVVVTAHAKMRKFEQPDELGAYDRWEMKLTKQTAPMVKEWADMVLFCNYINE